MALYTQKGASIAVRKGITSINGFLVLNQTNVYLTSGNFSKGAAVFNPSHTGSANAPPPAPVEPTFPGTNYLSAVSTPVPNYLIGNSLGATTYAFSVTNGSGTTLYTNGSYTVSTTSLLAASNLYQCTNLFNPVSGSKGWYSASVYTGATVNNCKPYTGTTSTIVNGTTYLGEWCQIQLPHSISITRFSYYTLASSYGRVALVGSNDGTNWGLIYTQTSNIYNGGEPSPGGNGPFTTVPTTVPYYSYVRMIALVGQTSGYASYGGLVLQGNINAGNTVRGVITSATYGTVTGASVTINLTGTYTSFNLIRTNITSGNVVVTYYGLMGTTYVDNTVSSVSIYSYSIVPVNYTTAGTAFSVGNVTTPPAAPFNLVLSAKTNTTMTLSFTPSSGTGITYTVFTTNVGGYSATGTASPITIYNLQPNTSYSIVARATNSFGTSANSNTMTNVTGSSIPNTVSGLTITSYTDTSAVISFAIDYNATNYTIYVGGVSNVVGTSSPLTVTGLSTLISYSITAKASNIFGSGSLSSAITLNTRASPPTNLAFSSDPSGNTFGVITFTISPGNIKNYTATLNTGQVVTSETSFKSVTFIGLLPNTPYTATIVANPTVTTFASSLPSDPISFTIPSNPYIFSGSLATLNGFKNFGGRTGTLNGVGYALFDSSNYGYLNLGQSLLGKTIEFYSAYTANSRCFFGCNDSGAGNVVRIGASNTATNTFFTSSTSWTTISAGIQIYNSTAIYGANFIPVKIVISDTGSLTLYIYNILKTIVSGSYTMNELGYNFGFVAPGDGSQVSINKLTIRSTPTSSSLQAIPIPGYTPTNSPGVLTTTFDVTTGSDSTSYTNGTYVITASSIANSLTTTSITNPITPNPGDVSWLSGATYSGTSYAYNGTVSTIASGTTYLGEWYQIQFPYLFKLFTIDILTNSSTQIWTFVGSNDGITWNLIKVGRIHTSANNVFFTILIDSPNYYYYYRIILSTGFSGNSASIAKGITMRGDIM